MGRRTLIITFALKASRFRTGTHGRFSRGSFSFLPLPPIRGWSRTYPRGEGSIHIARHVPGAAASSSNGQTPLPPNFRNIWSSWCIYADVTFTCKLVRRHYDLNISNLTFSMLNITVLLDVVPWRLVEIFRRFGGRAASVLKVEESIKFPTPCHLTRQ
jgi:hypothetical protein